MLFKIPKGLFRKPPTASVGPSHRAPQSGVILTGDDRVNQMFMRLEDRVQRRLFKKTLKHANNKIIYPQNIIRAPVSRGWRNHPYGGGNVKESLSKKPLKRSRKRWGYVTFSDSMPEYLAMNVRYHTYAPEFGTKNQDAQHFMRNATYDESDRVHKFVADDLADEVNKINNGQ